MWDADKIIRWPFIKACSHFLDLVRVLAIFIYDIHTWFPQYLETDLMQAVINPAAPSRGTLLRLIYLHQSI